MVINLGEKNSIFNQFLSEIRDQEIQKDSMRFRKNMERLGELFAYEISKKLEYIDKDVISPLGISHMKVIKQSPVLATILRAGLPLHQGMLNYFDSSECAFVSAYRRHHKNGRFDIQLEYASSPSLDKKVLILIDPMLATGGSLADAIEFVKKHHPKKIISLNIIAAPEGLEVIEKSHADIDLFIAQIDEKLNEDKFIIPGLGDAGDRAYNTPE